jgi:hypothetical protein
VKGWWGELICNTLKNIAYYTKDIAMTLTVRLPERVEQELAEYSELLTYPPSNLSAFLVYGAPSTA